MNLINTVSSYIIPNKNNVSANNEHNNITLPNINDKNANNNVLESPKINKKKWKVNEIYDTIETGNVKKSRIDNLNNKISLPYTQNVNKRNDNNNENIENTNINIITKPKQKKQIQLTLPKYCQNMQTKLNEKINNENANEKSDYAKSHVLKKNDEKEQKKEESSSDSDNEYCGDLIKENCQQTQKNKNKECKNIQILQNEIKKDNDNNENNKIDKNEKQISKQNMAEIQQFKCNLKCIKCNNEFEIKHGLFANNEILKYLHQWFCKNCECIESNKNESKNTSFKCIEKCRNNGKIWDGKNALKNWKQHYNRYHPTETYLKITNQHICINEYCKTVISNENELCKIHSKIENEEKEIQELKHKENENINKEDIYIIKDKANSMFDIRRTMQKIDTNFRLNGDQEKAEAANIISTALHKIAKSNQNLDIGIEGAIELRLYAPTYHFCTLRNDNKQTQKEKNIRDNLFKMKSWNELMNRIETMQNKRNEKKQKRQQRNDKTNENESLKKNQNVSNNNLNNIINLENLLNKIETIKYEETETKMDVIYRIKQCIKEVSEARFKKGVERLNDTKLANIENTEMWQKLKNKFPKAQNIQTNNENINNNNTKFNMEIKEMKASLLKLNRQSKGGNGGIDNKFITWMVENNDVFKFIENLKETIKTIYEHGLPNVIRDLLCYAKGIPLLKNDDDVRPIVMLDSIVRIMDRLIIQNMSRYNKLQLMGKYQSIGIEKGCEIATQVAENAREFITRDKDLCIISLDASNAYSSVSRNMQYKLICEKCPELKKYFEFLYGKEIICDFDETHRIEITEGDIQGLNSSELLYAMTKNEIQKQTCEIMKTKMPEFKIVIQNDYCDDGLTIMKKNYIKEYIHTIENEYAKYNIKINKNKTKIIFNNNNENFKHEMNKQLSEYTLEFNGNFTYLGIPHGNDNYINDETKTKFKKIYKQLLHIQFINSTQIKNILLRKFYNYNKIIYVIKNTKLLNEWLNDVYKMYEYMQNTMIENINTNKTIKQQMYISRRNGGLGMQPVQQLVMASQLTSSYDMAALTKTYNNFEKIKHNEELIKYDIETINYNKIIMHCNQRMNNKLSDAIQNLNETLNDDNKLESSKFYKHSELNKIIDRNNIENFYAIATVNDLARIKSAANNGASSWMDAVPNKTYGAIYSNKQYIILMSLLLGAPLNVKETQCIKCNDTMDKFGYHGLHCKFQHHCISRHNAIRNEMAKLFERAGFEVKIEQKMNDDENIKGTPGDITVSNWDLENEITYFDISIININAESYVKAAANARLGAASVKEKQKQQKYNNHKNFKPLIMESIGGIGKIFKKTLQIIAHKIATRTNKKYEIIINQIRTKIISTMMHKNAVMIEAAMPF